MDKNILEFSIFKPYSNQIAHGITTKPMGSFDDKEKDFRRQSEKLPFTLTVFSNQIHGDDVVVVHSFPKEQLSGDSFITYKKNIPLAIKVADCQGILIFDPVTEIISAIHAGWKSLSKEIIKKTINKLKKEFGVNPNHLLIGISPSLGKCCARFSDPEAELPKFMKPFIDNHMVDLCSASKKQVTDAGVPENQIEIINECTKCNPNKYFSHRNGDKGRMAVFISLT